MHSQESAGAKNRLAYIKLGHRESNPTERRDVIIQTRYRDIPFEEAIQCHVDASDVKPERWELARGTAISIEVPGVPGPVAWARCSGPFFRSSWKRLDGRYAGVCPHIAEIGD